MSRAALLCCTALALVLGTGAAHGADKPNPVCFKLTEYSQDQDPFGFGAMFQSLDLMIDCSWLKWAIQYVEHHDPLTERLARESKPLSDRLIEQNQDRPPPMSPRGTFPPLTVVNNDWGGRLHEYEARWQQVAIGGGPVEIMGWCVSGCTLLAAYIPKERLCFGEGAALYFHQARAANDGEVMWSVTKRMIDRFPPEIRSWIATKGGWMNIPSDSYWFLPASELWKMGYRKCSA